jgi:hypothetical protein
LAAGRSKGRLATLGSVIGLAGTLVCSLSMIAAPLGLIAAGGTAAAQGGMAGMSSTGHGGTTSTDQTGHGGMADMDRADHDGAAGTGSMDQSKDRGGTGAGAAHAPGWLDALLRYGPVILVVSVLLVAVSVALRRRLAALPAIGGGLILYVGMYAQPNLAVMYGTIIVGTALLVLAYVASLRWPKIVGRRTG